MDGVSGISAVGGYAGPSPAYMPQGVQGATAGEAASTAATAGMTNISASSVSSLSVTSESLYAAQTPAANNNELLGAVLLALLLQFLQSGDQEEKNRILEAVAGLLQQPRGGGASETMHYSSTSLQMESSTIQTASIGSALATYGQGVTPVSPAPAGDSGAINALA